MTTLDQVVLTDMQRAAHARAKARRALTPLVADVVCDRIDELRQFTGLVDRGRWRRLVDEVMNLPEPTPTG